MSNKEELRTNTVREYYSDWSRPNRPATRQPALSSSSLEDSEAGLAATHGTAVYGPGCTVVWVGRPGRGVLARFGLPLFAGWPALQASVSRPKETVSPPFQSGLLCEFVKKAILVGGGNHQRFAACLTELNLKTIKRKSSRT